MHFMNPVPVMKLVEIIPSLTTSQPTLKTTLELAKAMEKTTTLSQDVPGFIANRVLMPYINEAVFVLQEVCLYLLSFFFFEIHLIFSNYDI
jgi:3-hydroxybutyryl-CoA dehydrogenase